MWNIVIVDDEVRIAEGLAKIISKINTQYHVVEKFHDSELAYQYLKKNHDIDLLITDICMPKLSGLELVEKVRKFDRNLPCIILTGFGEFEYAKKAISLGVISYLLKPIDVEELKTVIERFILCKKESLADHIYFRSELSKEVIFIKHEIEVNYKDFDMNRITEQLALDKDYLYRLFKKELGMNVSDYLLDIRMQQAKKYLSETGKYKVYEVCNLVGYKDHIYFSKIFKKKFNMTPKEFQKYGVHRENS